MPDDASDNFPTLVFVNLALDELGAVDSLCLESIVVAAQRPQKSLVVAVVDRKGPLVLDLESGSRAAPPSIETAERALETSSF